MLKGSIVALVTPFNNDGSVNEKKHKERIETSMNQLITALVNEMNKFFSSDNDW